MTNTEIVDHFGQANHLSNLSSHPRPTQPSTLSGTGNEYQPKRSNPLQLGVEDSRHDSFLFIPLVDKCVGGR